MLTGLDGCMINDVMQLNVNINPIQSTSNNMFATNVYFSFLV